VQFYLDGQAVPNEGEQIGSRPGTMIVPGGDDSHGFMWTGSCGIHTVEVRVDVNEEVVESVEANNYLR